MTQQVETAPEEKVVKGQLLDLVIETTLGAEYVFPDMDAQESVRLVQHFEHALSMTQLTLVNATGACLALPTRVIKAIRVVQNGTRVIEWARPR